MVDHWQRMTNRNNATWEQLEPYFGRFVTWNEDYTAIVDSDTDYAAILGRTPSPPEDGFGQTVEYIPDPRVEERYQPLRPLTPEEMEELVRAVSLPSVPAAGERLDAPPA